MNAWFKTLMVVAALSLTGLAVGCEEEKPAAPQTPAPPAQSDAGEKLESAAEKAGEAAKDAANAAGQAVEKAGESVQDATK